MLQQPARERLVLLEIDTAAAPASDADATGGEPIFKEGVGIGRVTWEAVAIVWISHLLWGL